jgi:hypothetical protein
MIVKPILISVALAALASTPIAVPMAAGIPVAVAIGPIAITYDRANSLDLKLDVACMSSECPVIELRYGVSGQETLKVGL